MKKIQIEQKASQQAKASSRKKRPVFWVLALCLMLGSGMAVSASLLGTSIGRFSKEDVNVILLVPPKEAAPESEGNVAEDFFEFKTKSVQQESSDAGSAASPRYTTGTTSYIAAQASERQGEQQMYDDILAWNSETQVDLFKDSYDGTVKSDDEEKVIAPGTSNFYNFTLKNNVDFPLDYSISLEVGTYLGEQDHYASIPLEWRLLAGDKTVLSDWKGYNERTQILKQGTLEVRHQDNYTVEWRWGFEKGEGMDKADTDMGNIAVDQPLGVKAAIYVYAEQKTDEDVKPPASEDEPEPGDIVKDPSHEDEPEPGDTVKNPSHEDETKTGDSLHRGETKTGDSSNIFFYIVLMAISSCGILIVLVMNRRRRKDEDGMDAL